jgi:hypothetical protein
MPQRTSERGGVNGHGGFSAAEESAEEVGALGNTGPSARSAASVDERHRKCGPHAVGRSR